MVILISINVLIGCAVAFCLVTPRAARMAACWWWAVASAVEAGREAFDKMWSESMKKPELAR